MANFIVVEGLDGSGKTEISKRIAAKLEAIWMKTPPDVLIPIRQDVSNFSDISVRFHYYMIGNLLASHQIEQELKQGKSIVCDRYIDSTLVYFQWRGLNIDKTIWQGKFLKPHLKIFLDVSFDERMKRMSSRHFNTQEDDSTRNLGVHDFLREAYLKCGGWLVIDTEKFYNDMEKEANFIVDLIRKKEILYDKISN